MAQEPLDKRRFFKGYTGWTITFEQDIWMLKSQRVNDTFAMFTVNKDYPMGRRTWMITNDVCSGSGEHPVSLVITACQEDQFTCDDGSCISMNSRCDRKEDCAVLLRDKLIIHTI